MTRKDYIIIAAALNGQYKSACAGICDSSADTVDGIMCAAKAIADALAIDNPRFDIDHFMDVVRGEKELHSKPKRKEAA